MNNLPLSTIIYHSRRNRGCFEFASLDKLVYDDIEGILHITRIVVDRHGLTTHDRQRRQCARIPHVKNGRPSQKLFPLEIRCVDTEEDKVQSARGGEGKTDTSQRVTSKKASAVIGNKRIGQYLEEEYGTLANGGS